MHNTYVVANQTDRCNCDFNGYPTYLPTDNRRKILDDDDGASSRDDDISLTYIPRGEEEGGGSTLISCLPFGLRKDRSPPPTDYPISISIAVS